jgi:hypothetical protein
VPSLAIREEEEAVYQTLMLGSSGVDSVPRRVLVLVIQEAKMHRQGGRALAGADPGHKEARSHVSVILFLTNSTGSPVLTKRSVQDL